MGKIVGTVNELESVNAPLCIATPQLHLLVALWEYKLSIAWFFLEEAINLDFWVEIIWLLAKKQN